jgi:hypothetical protein
MTIDERLEALTQSLELLTSIVAENQKRQTLAEERQARAEERYERAEAALQERFMLLAELLRSHDARLDKLEGR